MIAGAVADSSLMVSKVWRRKQVGFKKISDFMSEVRSPVQSLVRLVMIKPRPNWRVIPDVGLDELQPYLWRSSMLKPEGPERFVKTPSRKFPHFLGILRPSRQRIHRVLYSGPTMCSDATYSSISDCCDR
jgi:hypothetical protein